MVRVVEMRQTRKRSRRFQAGRRPAAVLALTGLLLAVAGGAQAATFTVRATADAPLKTASGTTCVSTDGGSCTLRAAVQAADNLGGSNTIVLPRGTYRITRASAATDDPSTGDYDVNAGVRLTVRGAGIGRTILDANHLDRAFAVQAPAGVKPAGVLTVEGLTITHGDAGATAVSSNSNSSFAGYGGAIFNAGALTLRDVALLDSGAEALGGAITSLASSTSTIVTDSQITGDYTLGAPGGGIAALTGSLTVSHTRFDSDKSYGAIGGAIYMASGSPMSISASQFNNNWAVSGGAIEDDSGAAMIAGSSFVDNGLLTPGHGGALVLNDSASGHTSSVTGSTFSGNSGAQLGGAVYDGSAAIVMFNRDRFTGNSAFGAGGGVGGAIDTAAGGPVTIENSLLEGNQSGNGGAVALNSSAPAVMLSDTLDGNTAIHSGGAVLVGTGGIAELARLTIARNSAGSGGGISDPNAPFSVVDTLVADNFPADCSAAVGGADLGHNLDSDGTCFASGGSPEASGDLIKRDPKLGPSANYGGPLNTLALLPGSPAIGAGACGLSGVTTDARGIALPATGCDIGAFQTAESNLVLHATHGKPRLHRRMTLRFRIANAGPGPALASRLTVRLPAHMRLVRTHSSQGRCSGRRTVSCVIGVLNSSATGGVRSATVTVVVVPLRKGRSKLTAALTSGTKDQQPKNNRSTLRLRVR